MNLDFASPMYLLGLLGISLPVLVHLLTRHQQTHIKFSAVYLLFQSQKRSIKRHKPNRLLLLLIRCLAIACLSFALANPIFSFGETDDFFSAAPSANVFILDDSYSMATRAKNETLYAKALRTLADTFKRTSPGSSFSLVLASSPARTIQDWTPDPNILLKRLTLSKPSYRTTDIGGAVSEALELLKTAPRQAKRIFILTDGDKNGWVPENFPEADEYGQPPPSAKVMNFSGYQTDENRAAIENVDVTQSFLASSRVLRVKARVANLLHGKPVRDLRLTLWVNGRKQSETSLNLPENSAVDKEFSFPYLGDEPATGFVEIGEDALGMDNRRHFTYQPDKRVKALIVDGDPNAVAHQSETFYLEHALNPFYGTLSDIEPTVVTRSELPAHDLLLYSIVMLSNVRDLPFDYERELEKFVLRGGALFISLGDQIEAKFYNEKMGNLLPMNIESLNQVEIQDKPFRFLLKPSDHPVLNVFKGKILQEMNSIRIYAYYSVQAREGAVFQVPMRFQDGSPAVVESEFGKGKVILFVSTIDRDWNDFPIQPTFLPWIQRWVKYSARSLESLSREDLLIGQPFTFEKEETTSIFVQTPQGNITPMTASGSPDQVAFENTFWPGVYPVFRTLEEAPEETSPSQPDKNITLPPDAEKIGHFTVNVDTRESVSTKISEAEIRRLLAGMASAEVVDPQSRQPGDGAGETPLSTPLLLLVAFAFFWEGWHVRRE